MIIPPQIGLQGLSPMFVFGLVIMFITILIFVITLKGYSLWSAAKRDEKWWFIILLVVNTFGILELIYLVFIVKKWNKNIDKTRDQNNILVK